MKEFLSIPEEITLLTIDEKGGETPGSKSFDAVLAGSVLMELAIHNRIDSDLKHLIKVSSKATGDVVLDDMLGFIFKENIEKEPAYWISQIGLRADEMIEQIIATLIIKKILKVENQKVLWMFSTRKYPLTGDKEIKEVKSRVRELVFGTDLPDLRDIVIISLVYYGSMLSMIFSDDEIKKHKTRIEQIAKMDLIGQSIAKSLQEFSRPSQISSKAKAVFGRKTPEQKLDEFVIHTKEKFRIKKEEDLPEWLRKGTAQYNKTLDFVADKGTAEIYYDYRKKQYFVKKFSAYTHSFGSGEY
ncbi:MAG: GPP34 family phosphoprotein [Bacteroidia bacterium]|nr:GPP34 family phosphoprotein [Bacteroidia bacterium]